MPVWMHPWISFTMEVNKCVPDQEGCHEKPGRDQQHPGSLSRILISSCLQEVDRDSKRSYHINQFRGQLKISFQITMQLFWNELRCGFCSHSPYRTHGKGESGLMTLSKQGPVSVERHSFPGNYSWPMKLFMLDRCFLVSRYAVSNRKELLIINTHNSAYDDGSLRAQQMNHLSAYLLAEYEKGNYIIVGGDWNQTPFGFEPELPSHRFDNENLSYIEKDYPAAGWHWAYDPELPTNRRVATPYDRANSLTTVIDCFLASPNVELSKVKTVDLDFQYSDHQPVQVEASLSKTSLIRSPEMKILKRILTILLIVIVLAYGRRHDLS